MTDSRSEKEILAVLETKMENVEKVLVRVERYLEDGQKKFNMHDVAIERNRGQSEKACREIEEHRDGHWKAYALLIAVTGTLATVIALALKLAG